MRNLNNVEINAVSGGVVKNSEYNPICWREAKSFDASAKSATDLATAASAASFWTFHSNSALANERKKSDFESFAKVAAPGETNPGACNNLFTYTLGSDQAVCYVFCKS